MMDGRAYDSLTRVSPSQFTEHQRRRLEAFTAATGLLPDAASVVEKLAVAVYIETGVIPDVVPE